LRLRASIAGTSLLQTIEINAGISANQAGRPAMPYVGAVPDIRLAFYLSGLLRLGATIDPMRLLIGPIAVLIVLCGWDFYFNHGKFTLQTVAGTSEIARRMF